jgi:hypothetical protein
MERRNEDAIRQRLGGRDHGRRDDLRPAPGDAMSKPLTTGYRADLPVTPATLRGRIAIRAELLRGVDVESVRYLNQQQQIAALERQLAALEGGR